MQKNKIFFLIGFFILAQLGCGVKGKPTAPNDPPVIGSGESLYQQQKQKKETKNKTKTRALKDMEESP